MHRAWLSQSDVWCLCKTLPPHPMHQGQSVSGGGFKMSWSWNSTPFCSRGRLLLGSSIMLATWSSGYQLFFPFHQRCAMCMEQKARCSEYYINVINVYFSSHCRIYCSFIHGSVVLDDEDDGGGDDMQARQWSRCNFKGEKVICQKHLWRIFARTTLDQNKFWGWCWGW